MAVLSVSASLLHNPPLPMFRPPQVRERKPQLARLETLDMGKPIAEAECDLDDVAAAFDFYAGEFRMCVCASGGWPCWLLHRAAAPVHGMGLPSPAQPGTTCHLPSPLTQLATGLAEQLDGRQYEAVDLGSDDFRCALRREPLGVVVSAGPARRHSLSACVLAPQAVGSGVAAVRSMRCVVVM